MRAVIPYLLCLLVGALAACSSNDETTTTTTTTQALQGPVRPVRELVSGGARLRGGTFRMDVQIGRPLAHVPVRAGDVSARPAAVVTP